MNFYPFESRVTIGKLNCKCSVIDSISLYEHTNTICINFNKPVRIEDTYTFEYTFECDTADEYDIWKKYIKSTKAWKRYLKSIHVSI